MARTKRLVALAFQVSIPVFLGLLVIIRLFFFQIVRISGNSMFPTLKSGQFVIAYSILCYADQVERNDIVLVQCPGSLKLIIKRVVGIPGDKITISQDGIFRNNELITSCNNSCQNNEIIVVPPGSYFLLGDNVSESIDSRTLGMFTEASIIGKVRCTH